VHTEKNKIPIAPVAFAGQHIHETFAGQISGAGFPLKEWLHSQG
jgi:hypothetical protein